MLSNEHGYVLSGRHVKPYLFQGATTMGRLAQMAPDPAILDNPKAIKTPEQERILSLRAGIQRKLQHAKKKNAKSYAHNMYHEHVETPAITLVSLQSLPTESIPVQGVEDQLERILVPYGLALIAADGDTQLAARYANMRLHPETIDDQVSFQLYHGRTEGHYRQIFHDFQMLGVTPTVSQALGGNGRDPFIRICREVEARPFFAHRVGSSRQRQKHSSQVINLTALHNSVKCLLTGRSGITKKPAELPMSEAEACVLATRWFDAVADAIGPEIADPKCVASSAGVFPALGILGYERRRQDPANWLSRASELKQINWRSGPHWGGVAGAWDQDRRKLLIAGPKTTTHVVVNALMDGSSLGYQAIRKTA